jgi:hypothetical protein
LGPRTVEDRVPTDPRVGYGDRGEALAEAAQRSRARGLSCRRSGAPKRIISVRPTTGRCAWNSWLAATRRSGPGLPLRQAGRCGRDLRSDAPPAPARGLNHLARDRIHPRASVVHWRWSR